MELFHASLGDCWLSSVMDNFMCQLDWATECPDILSNTSLVCLWTVYLDENNIWIGRVKLIAFPIVLGPHPANWRPELKKKILSKRDSAWLLELGHGPSNFKLEFVSSAPLVLWPSDPDWHYTPGTPGSQACQVQVLGLCSLHNCMSQFLIMNLFININIEI